MQIKTTRIPKIGKWFSSHGVNMAKVIRWYRTAVSLVIKMKFISSVLLEMKVDKEQAFLNKSTEIVGLSRF